MTVQHAKYMREYWRRPGVKERRYAYIRSYLQRPENITRDRDRKRYARYGITQEQYDAMLISQEGRCAICGTDQWGGSGNRPHIDHDHATKKVRGLLCFSCNVTLGWMERKGLVVTLMAMKYLGSEVILNRIEPPTPSSEEQESSTETTES